MNMNSAMEPAKYAKHTKAEELGLMARRTRRVNPGTNRNSFLARPFAYFAGHSIPFFG